MEELEKSIVRTIAFYDAVGGVALSKIELYKYLINPAENISFGVFYETLERKWQSLKPHISRYRGFYFLKKNKDGYVKRIATGKTSIKKQQIAKRMARIISFMPYVRMVAITGSLSQHSTNKNSDIDILIVVKSGHIWTTRMLVSAITHVLGKRRHGNRVKDRICLNHYISDDRLSLRPGDMFSAHINASLIPLWSSGKTYELFEKENTHLVKSYFPNHKKVHVWNRRNNRNGIEFLFSLFEPLFRNIQLKKIRHNFQIADFNPQEMKSVIFDDHALVFHHPRPINQKAVFLYERNLKELGLNP